VAGLISDAFGGDSRIAADAALVVEVVGRVQASGAFAPIDPEDQHNPKQVLAEMDHAAWNAELAKRTARRAAELKNLPPDDPGVEDAASVWAATIKERDKGLVQGPFSAADMDARFGAGNWRGIQRFDVWQKGKCRACDNCAESLHNEATIMEESLICDTADFPARAAALMVAVLGAEVATQCILCGGTEDVEAAYRRILSACPGASVFCLPDPAMEEPVLFWLNFGLQSALVSFSRFPRLAMQLCRRVLGIVLYPLLRRLLRR
jgi:ferredoxin